MFGRKKLLKRIEVLENQIRRLENMHATIHAKNSWELPDFVRTGPAWESNYGRVGFFCGRQLTGEELCVRTPHPQPAQVDYRRLTNVPTLTADTKRIPEVTFDELARYVLDKEPITRQEEVSAKRISEYTEDNTTTIIVAE